MRATPPTNRGQVQPMVAVALGVIAIAGIVAALLVSRPIVAAPRPSASPAAPAPTPTAIPTAKPVATPTPTPTSDPTSSLLTVELENLTDHDVKVQIQDPNGILAGARSGQPGDGMSVRWHDALIQQVDANTVAFTFVGLPQDEVADLVVDAIGGDKVVLRLVQTGPVPNSDAMGEDRILILTFREPVDAADFSFEILDRTVD
jgi:hypothetical protein